MAPPRSSSYERLELEGGMGPSRIQNRFAWWKKFAIAAGCIIGLVWFFGPRRPKDLGWGRKKDHAVQRPILDEVDTKPLPPPPMPPVTTGPQHADYPHPTSYSSDPDHLKTVYCSAPAKPSNPLVQYALMIDAGSTGSRIHIYKFNNCGSSPTYEYEVFKMTQPGLSSFQSPSAAAESLDVLLDEAVKVVPESLRKCTPVAVKATAGLRLLGSSQSKDILDAIERRLRDNYPFPLQDKDGVVIMDGKDEGVYAWITANYLLNTIRADSPRDTPSYAVLDLGGASTQIAFEPKFSKPDSSLIDGEHKYDLKFGGRTHVLYQHSYLGYGLMRARKSVHRLVDFMSSLRTNTKPGAPIGNPCLAKGMQRIVGVTDESSGVTKNVTMVGEDIGGFEACDRVMQLVMAKDAICEVKPCSFDGVYQPSLLDTFPTGKILLLSYFYDRIQPLMPKHNPPHITVATLSNLAKDVCQGKSVWTKKWGNNKEAMEELEDRPEYCLDLTFMHALLRLGYEFGDDREVAIGKQIEGTELGWCLGATITMVAGDLKCRI